MATPYPITPKGLVGVVDTLVAIKTTAGELYGLSINNTGQSRIFLQVFNLATGTVVLGTTVPDLVIGVEPDTVNYSWSPPANVERIKFGTAISVAATTTSSGLTAAPAATVDVSAFIG